MLMFSSLDELSKYALKCLISLVYLSDTDKKKQVTLKRGGRLGSRTILCIVRPCKTEP